MGVDDPEPEQLTMTKKVGVHMVKNKVPQLARSIRELTKRDVLVGIPASESDRNSDEITNPELGYIHENGVPELNIPARPFLVPGVREGQGMYVKYLKQAVNALIKANESLAEKALTAAGQAGAIAVQQKIHRGPFTPLQPSTIARRRRRSAGSTYRRVATTAAQVSPLIDTAQLLRSITYVVRGS